MTANAKPTTLPVEKLEDGLAVWYCDRCRVRYPHLGRDSWEFVNESGDCPRCAARRMAEADNIRGSSAGEITSDPLEASSTPARDRSEVIR